MAKKTVKKNVKNANVMIKTKKEETTETCCEKRWNLVPLRFALGLMFIAAGLSKLFTLIGGENSIPSFFASLGIPLPLYAAWLVAIVEILGGAFLMLGFMTCLAGTLLVIVIAVATITTSIKTFGWLNMIQHLVYIGALVAIMCGNKDFSLKPKVCRNCCKK